MGSKAGNIAAGQHPLMTWRNRVGTDVRKWAGYLPELHVTIGRDDLSAGLTITVWEPSPGEFATYRTLYAVRWADPVMSTEEALEICYRGVAAALAELFGVEVG